MKISTIITILSVVIILIGCASGITKKDKEMLETEALAVLNDGMKHDDNYVKMNAADAMKEIADPSFVPALLEALYDADDIVVMKAARALGAIGDTTAIPDLELTLDFDPNFSAQKAAVTLYRLGKKKEALEFIKDGLKDDSSFRRSIMLNELTFARSDDFIPLYIEMLDDPVGSVRKDAINAIALRNAREAVPHLMEALRDSFLVIRADAIIVIPQIGDTAHIRQAMDITEQEINNIEKGELDTIIEFDEYQLDIYRTLLASTLLIELQDTTYLGELYDKSMSPVNPVSILSTLVLADWGDEYAIKMVGDFLVHDEVHIREAIVDIIGDINKDWACQYLIQATNDPEENIRKHATRLLQFYNKKKFYIRSTLF
ncbi:MAG TPA: HEAT repeat domain-containing protein [Candidatus Cloacimonetes bacterium]|nr:HEAT repeat domain-containing protein [Candidatus Cloacimonadota bacterium]HEX38053.1 HEAT repeat domain-containing protein [Candidatus Cloacimonadota bacterium]